MSRKPGAKRWDRYFVALVGLFTLAELIIPGHDHRWMWTPQQALWKHLIGVGFLISGTLGLLWAMKANRFFRLSFGYSRIAVIRLWMRDLTGLFVIPVMRFKY